MICVKKAYFGKSGHSRSQVITNYGKVKAKVTLKQAAKTQRYSRGIAVSLTSALDGCGWSTPRPGRFTPGKDPVLFI